MLIDAYGGACWCGNCSCPGFSPMEALVNVSLQPSVLDAAVMSYSMLKPGQEVNGTVLSVDTYGVLVTLGKNIRGLVTQFHVADVLLKTKKVRRRV